MNNIAETVFLIILIGNAVFLCLKFYCMEVKQPNETKKQKAAMPDLQNGAGHIFAGQPEPVLPVPTLPQWEKLYHV